VIGIDPELKFIEYAESQAKKQGVENSTYINKNIEEYTSPTLFDCIVSTDVLEHIQDDLGVFNKLLTHLKPNGVCIIIVPALPILYGHHDKQLGHYRRYSKKMLTDLVSKQVRIQSTRYFGWSMLPVAFWYSKIIKQPYPVAQVGDYENKIAEIIDIVLQIDARIQLPFGTSLMLEGTLTPPSAPKA
jgi:SAM-dependent methyltransferase